MTARSSTATRYVGLRLADDEIAVASLLSGMAKWCRDDGPPPYPLAEGSQDHLVSLAIDASLATGGAALRPPKKSGRSRP